MLSPLPAILVSCGNSTIGTNLFTASWTGVLCSEPPICYVSVRPERYSYGLIDQTGEFVLNLTTEAMARATDWCGVRSGRDYDKWRECGLTPAACAHLQAPQVLEAPVSIECKVTQKIELGSHHLFMGAVQQVWVEDKFIHPTTGKLDLKAAGLLCYAHGEYFGLGDFIGYFGWSVKKGSAPQRRS